MNKITNNKDDIAFAICDDEYTQRNYITTIVQKWADKSNTFIDISHYESAESFLFNYEENKLIDILLLDIQMKEIDGIELAHKIREENKNMQIVFITGYPDFMAEGYDVSALHYLIKPVKEDKLFEVLDKAQKNLKQTEKSLFLTINREMHRILLSEIRYIEAQGHYIIVNTISNSFKTKMNLSEIQTTLSNEFFRCQRSFIVNLKYIRKITKTTVILDNMTEIPLSRNLYETINQAIITFFP